MTPDWKDAPELRPYQKRYMDMVKRAKQVARLAYGVERRRIVCPICHPRPSTEDV